MNLLLADLMSKPSHIGQWCATCGSSRQLNAHHVVKRSQGGTDGPRITLCGSGTTGCHGKAHDARLHFRHDDGWWWLETPAAMKYDAALAMPGWRRVK